MAQRHRRPAPKVAGTRAREKPCKTNSLHYAQAVRPLRRGGLGGRLRGRISGHCDVAFALVRAARLRTIAFVALRSSRRERLQDERRRPAPRDSGACRRCRIAPRPTRTDLLEARTSSHAASAHVAVPRRGILGAQLVGGYGSAVGLRVGQVIVKLFFAGVGSATAALNARTSNVYLRGFSCL